VSSILAVGSRVRSINSRALGTVVSGQHIPIGWGDTLIPVHWDACSVPGKFRESEMEVVSPLEELAEQAE
jgi:hypothetical protein